MRTADAPSSAYRDLITGLCLLLAAAVWLFGQPAHAQDIAPAKIAVIKMQTLEREALAWKDLRAKFQAENDKVVAELRAAQATFESEREALLQQQAILAPDAFTAKREEFEARFRNMSQQTALRQQALERALLQSRAEIIEVVREIVVGIAEAQGLNLILDASSADPTIVLSKPEIEITDTVLRELDSRLSAVSFTVVPAQ
jgi:outer membrane protein